MAQPFYRQGAASKPAPTPTTVKISFEDGSEAHVTPQHAAEIRARASRFIRASRGEGEMRGAKDIPNDYRS